MNFLYSSISKTGLRRNTNEDSVGVFTCKNGILVVVCDGLGGNKAGEVASKLTVDTIYNYFDKAAGDDYLKVIKNSIIEANNKILSDSLTNEDFQGMATTVEVVFISGNVAYWGHVGDSRIYYLSNHKLKQLTKDHSLVQKLVDEGYLTIKEAENHPNKNIIIKAVGDSTSIDADISKLKFNDSEDVLFFLCTDGVTTVINDQELEEILLSGNLNLISQRITAIVEERGAPDNFSFVTLIKNN